MSPGGRHSRLDMLPLAPLKQGGQREEAPADLIKGHVGEAVSSAAFTARENNSRGEDRVNGNPPVGPSTRQATGCHRPERG